MLRYLGRRLLHSLGVLLVVVTLIFFAVNVVGDPVRLMLPSEAPQSLVDSTREELGLDRPVVLRYFEFMGGLLVGNLGDSVWQRVPALPLVLDRLPATLLLTVVSLGFAVIVALVLGIAAAMKPRSAWDRIIGIFTLAGVSTAEFWLGLMLILVFAVELQVLPTSGYGGFEYIILPALALAMRPIGRLAQVTRTTLISEMKKPYILALRAKGMSERKIVTRHALKNAAIPILTIGGDELVTFLNGAVVIELIFAWPGIGSLFIEAIQRRDLQLIIACVVVVAIMVTLVNLTVDLLYAKLDPRANLSASRRKRLPKPTEGTVAVRTVALDEGERVAASDPLTPTQETQRT